MPKFENKDDFNIFSVLSDGSLNAEKQIIKGQVESDVRRLIEELPEDQKEVLIMRPLIYFAGWLRVSSFFRLEPLYKIACAMLSG